MKTQKLFSRDFTMVVIGQIISLFGNAVLRFALPLYLLNQTQSAALFGVVSACSFIPMIVLSPIGGIVADRVNKRNIMVVLDFCTAALALVYTLLVGKIDLTALTIATLILLYGIQGAYSPSVQASIPALVSDEQLIPANSVITLVNSLSSLIGPVIGGAVFGFWGIKPVLEMGIICFFASAAMEIFIHIPFEKKQGGKGILATVKGDMANSVNFIRTQKPVIFKIGIYVAMINLLLSALLIIGLPVIITQKLGFSQQMGNQLYGICEGALAAGGLLGGILAGVLSKRLRLESSYILLFAGSILILPIAFALLFSFSSIFSYFIILVCCFLIMAFSTIFSIQMLAYVQLVTPPDLVGKIMALMMTVSMCAAPLGQAMYGGLFEIMSDKLYLIFFFAAAASCAVALFSRKAFSAIANA